ncbi:MAG: hypothetical protein JWN49_38 [Parcubacteria group bacterium]|nr:hypothetical protein [Parcubacteria group bacterium]
MTNSVGSLESETVTINNDRELLEHFRMDAATASSYIGCSRQRILEGIGPENEPRSDHFNLSAIHLLVNTLRWWGRPFDAAAVRSYVDRTRLQNMPALQQENYDRLIALLVSPAERLVLTGEETLIFLMSEEVRDVAYPEVWSADQKIAFEAEVSALIAALDDRSKVYAFATSSSQARWFAQSFDVEESHCVNCDDVMHRLLSMLVCRGDEFKTYTFSEGGYYVDAPYQYWDYYDHARSLIART